MKKNQNLNHYRLSGKITFLTLICIIIGCLGLNATNRNEATGTSSENLKPDTDVLLIKTQTSDYYFELKKMPEIVFDDEELKINYGSECISLPMDEVITFSHSLPSASGVNKPQKEDSRLEITIRGQILDLTSFSPQRRTVTIIDLTGKELASISLTNGIKESISLSRFAPGVYLLYSDDHTIYKFATR